MRILRVTRTKHLTDISSHARKLAICCSAQSAARTVRRPHTAAAQEDAERTPLGLGRRQRVEKFDEQPAGVLEAAYQAGKQYVDFNVDQKCGVLI